MIPLVCRRFARTDARPLYVWFLVDSGSPFTCLTVNSLEALFGQGNVTHDVYNISIQDQTVRIQCHVSKAHFADVNILGADAMRKLELSIHVDWREDKFELIKR